MHKVLRKSSTVDLGLYADAVDDGEDHESEVSATRPDLASKSLARCTPRKETYIPFLAATSSFFLVIIHR